MAQKLNVSLVFKPNDGNILDQIIIAVDWSFKSQFNEKRYRFLQFCFATTYIRIVAIGGLAKCFDNINNNFRNFDNFDDQFIEKSLPVAHFLKFLEGL